MADGFGILSEGDIASEGDWISQFNGDRTVFTALLADGILRSAGFVAGRRQFSLNFVGLLAAGRSIWFSFPKASRARRIEDADLILHTIIDYRHRTLRAQSSADFSESVTQMKLGTIVDTFKALTTWTQDRGFHQHAVVQSRMVLEAIDWDRTISSTPAMHSNGSVVYPAPITRIQSSATSPLAEIQAMALLDLRGRLGVFADLLAPNATELWQECQEVLDLSEVNAIPSLIGGIIDDFATVTNRDEDLELIAILRDWTTEAWSAGAPVSPYGISSFHTVWEDICVKTMATLGTPISHAEVASQPTYLINGREIPLSPQRPDILLDRAGSIILADAKWYLLDANSLPQTPDAIKQFAYEQSIRNDLPVDANMLILPSEEHESWALAGVLQMKQAGSRDKRFKSISIIALNWKLLSRLYVRREGLADDFISKVVKLHASNQQEHEPSER